MRTQGDFTSKANIDSMITQKNSRYNRAFSRSLRSKSRRSVKRSERNRPIQGFTMEMLEPRVLLSATTDLAHAAAAPVATGLTVFGDKVNTFVTGASQFDVP